MKECTFAPRLMAKNFTDDSSIGEMGRRYEDLYNDAFYR
jgi:hypothetical protein